MNKNTILKKSIPYIVAFLVFLSLSMFYLSPLFSGKVLEQNDIRVHKATSNELADFRKTTGEEALWTNSMFGGMPGYQISVVYNGNLFKTFDRVFRLNLPRPADYVFLYFLGFFILLLVLGVNPWLSIVGAIAYALSSYFLIILGAGHNSKAHAIAYMAPVLAGILLTFKGRYLLGAAITGFFLALEIRAGHPQITYYLLLVVLVYGIVELVYTIREKKWAHFAKSVSLLAFVAILAVGTHFAMLWTTMEYGKESIRGKSDLTTEAGNRTSGLDLDYATQWSYGITETLTLMIPDVMGGGSHRTAGVDSEVYNALINNNVSSSQAKQLAAGLPLYFGDQPFTSGPVYVGAIISFLFILGLFVVKGRYKWWLLFATILSIMLAWGHNLMWFTELFMHYVPGYNKFRAVSMTLVMAELTIPLLGLLALKTFFDKKTDKKELLKNLKKAGAIAGGICLLIVVFPGLFFNFSSASDAQMISYGYPEWLIDALHRDRRAVAQKDALRSLVFIVLSFGLLWALAIEKIKAGYAIIAFGLLMIFDLWIVDKRYLNEDNFVSKKSMEIAYPTTNADRQIMSDKDPNFRVLNLTVDPFNDASTSYHHKSIGGYHGAKLRRYQELIEHHISKNNFAVLNMLNTKYFIQKEKDGAPTAIPNPSALGHVWLVDDTTLVNNADSEIAALTGFNPSKTAIIDKCFSANLSEFSPASKGESKIELTNYLPNHLTYNYNSDSERLAVFSEIYYSHGWNAYIDGVLEPHFRANFVLRAMMLPKGEHIIEFKFEPKAYRIGETVSLISSILLLLFITFVVYIEVKAAQKRKADKLEK